MNTFRIMTTGVFLGVLGVALAVPASEVFPPPALPELATMTAEVGESIAAGVRVQMRDALNAPRPARIRRSPSVFISEISDVVVVAATRLPPVEPLRVAKAARTAKVRM